MAVYELRSVRGAGMVGQARRAVPQQRSRSRGRPVPSGGAQVIGIAPPSGRPALGFIAALPLAVALWGGIAAIVHAAL